MRCDVSHIWELNPIPGRTVFRDRVCKANVVKNAGSERFTVDLRGCASKTKPTKFPWERKKF